MKDKDFNQRIHDLLEAFAKLPNSKKNRALEDMMNCLKSQSDQEAPKTKFGLAWIGSLFHLGNDVTAKTLEGEYKQLWDKTQSSS